MPFYSDPINQFAVFQLSLLLLAGTLALVLQRYANIPISLRPLLVGVLIFLSIPLLTALSHNFITHFLVLGEVLGLITPPDWVSRNLSRNLVPALSISAIFTAGYVTASLAPSRPLAHAIFLALLYPLPILVSCLLANVSGLLIIDYMELLGGPTLIFLLVVIPLCTLAGIFHPKRKKALTLLAFYLLLPFAFLGGSIWAEDYLDSLPAKPSNKPPIARPKIMTMEEVDATSPKPLTEGPKKCIGFHDFGSKTFQRGVPACPRNSAIFGAKFPFGKTHYTPAAKVSLEVDCCPLPFGDILSNKHSSTSTECPDGYVARSQTPGYCDKKLCRYPPHGELSNALKKYCINCSQVFQCTRINLKRYKLGEPRPGVSWGNIPLRWRERFTLLEGEIPPGLRPGLLRDSKNVKRVVGCVGFPFGSLLVAKKGTNCHDLSFRQLLYRGIPGDPPENTPVQIFPDYHQDDLNLTR